MRRVTVDRVMRWKPCPNYTRKRVADLWGNRKSLNEEQIANLPIPVQDRFWALDKLLTPQQRNRLARRIALDVIHLWNAPEIVAMAAAKAATWVATMAAAWAAASAAAWDKYLSWALEELTGE